MIFKKNKKIKLYEWRGESEIILYEKLLGKIKNMSIDQQIVCSYDRKITDNISKIKDIRYEIFITDKNSKVIFKEGVDVEAYHYYIEICQKNPAAVILIYTLTKLRLYILLDIILFRKIILIYRQQ